MSLRVLNPVAQKMQGKGSLAPRLSKLEGKLIGLYWNYKAGGDAALARVGKLFKEQHPRLETKIYVGSTGGAPHSLTQDDVKRIAPECVGVIGSTAD